MGFFSELKRRHVFRVAGAYLLLAWLVLQVTDTLISVLELPGGLGRIVFYVLVIGFPLAILASWIFEITPEGIKRESEVDHSTVKATSTGRAVDFVIIAALTVVVGFLAWDRFTPEDEFRSVAVLPIRSIDGDDTSVLFANGMHDTLLAELATDVGLDVIARRSVMEFAGSDKSIVEIAALLGVTHIVEASVQKFGDQLRVTAQLIETSSNKNVWADTYDEAIGFDNFFDVQSQIAEKISVSLEVNLVPATGYGSTNEEAVRDYLTAIKIFHEQYELAPDVESNLKSAVEKDPEFALAWVRLADVYQQKYWFLPDRDDASARDQAEEALARARAIDPDLPELHLVQAKIRYHGYLDYEGALAEFELAENAMPGAAEVFEWRGYVYRRLGDLPKALAALGRAIELAPRDQNLVGSYGTTLLFARRYAEAEAHYKQAVSDFPDSIGMRLALAGLYWSRDGDASAIIDALDADSAEDLALWAWRDGQLEVALEQALTLEVAEDPAGASENRMLVAFILQATGRQDEARPLFEQEAKYLAGKLDVDPNSVFDLMNAAHIALAMGETELATQHVDRLIDMAQSPDKLEKPVASFSAEALPSIYGPILCQMGDLDGAQQAFRHVLQRPGRDTVKSLINWWPPCREKMEGTPQYEALLQEFGHLSEG